jgi:hypothetical protein
MNHEYVLVAQQVEVMLSFFYEEAGMNVLNRTTRHTAAGSTAIKVIVFMGVLSFALLLLISQGLKQNLVSSTHVVIKSTYSPFKSDRAFKDLEAIVALGPRPPGSEALARCRLYIKVALAEAGVAVHEYPFTAETPLGSRDMVNLVGVIEGTKEGVILLSNHYDTKYFPNFNFVGANDGASTTAWMIEAARAFGPTREGRSLWLTWFDGEEALQEWSSTDGIYGSRNFVEHLRASGELDKIKVVINVDMIGDCLLRILGDAHAPSWLGDAVWDTAEGLGYGSHFSDFKQDIQDDHIPFRNAGIPSLEIIDFSYGGSAMDHRKNWHTSKDTLELVCPESLQAVADVLHHALPKIDAHLDKSGTL